MAPGVTLYGYAVALGGMAAGAWGGVAHFNAIWNDGFDAAGNKIYERNIVNMSWGGGASPFVANNYIVNVMTLTGYYLMVSSSGNAGPAFTTVTSAPPAASLVLTVGGGRQGGWLSPYLWESATN
jgi:hypothetical protein